jgi:hypothetical protein
MPFYFRIPLPGPFGYSKRIGGKRRKAVQQPARKVTAAERQEQHERASLAARTFIAIPRDVEHREDGSMTFLAEFGMDHSGRISHPSVQITFEAGDGQDVRWAIEEGEYLAVTFSPDLRTVESVYGT